MTKKRSKSLFVVFAIILVVLLVASFVNFTYPFTIKGNHYSYSNFVSNLSFGQDIGKSVRILHRVSNREGDSSNYEELRQSTINQLIGIAQSYGYYDITGATSGDDSILLQVGNIKDKEDKQNIISLIGSPADISFSIDENDVTKAVLFTKDVKSVDLNEGADGNTTVYKIKITFKDPTYAYDTIMANSTSGSPTLYAFLGEDTIINLGLGTEIEGIKETGQISFSKSGIRDRGTANRYVNMIRTGILDLQPTQIEAVPVSSSYGSWATISVAVVSLLVVLAMFIFLIIKYKQIGWVACFNLLFFITIGLFIMQSIPIMHINLSGIIGMLLCFILVADMHIVIIENAKYHYNKDTQLYVSFNIAVKETWRRILITLSLLLAAGITSVCMPFMALQSFGWAMLVLSLVGMFSTLALMRLFIKMYLPFNPQNGAKCNFHKGGNNG